MGLISALMLIVLGVLGASSFIISKKEDAKGLIDKLVPIQGIIGIIALIWGVIFIIMTILSIGIIRFGFVYIVWFIISLCAGVLLASLGFIFGFGLLKKHLLSKNDNAEGKAEDLLKKLVGIQVKLGIGAILLGVFLIVWWIMMLFR